MSKHMQTTCMKNIGMANNYPEKLSSAGGYNKTRNQHNNSNMANNRFRNFNECNGTLNISENRQTQSGVRNEWLADKKDSHVMGICELNNQPIKYLADTGSNRTIVNINAFELTVDKYEDILPIKGVRLVQAEGQPCTVLGQKFFKISLDAIWSIVTPVIISTQWLQPCIIGMDILSRYPGTKAIMEQLRYSVANGSRNIVKQYKPEIDAHFLSTVNDDFSR